MNFYEKPIYNYKLKCELDPEKDQTALAKQFGGAKQSVSWVPMLESYSELAVACLIVILVMPVSSGKGTFICTPIAFIVVAGMFVKPLLLTFDAANELEEEQLSMKAPEWINDCVDNSVTIAVENVESA